MIFITNEQAYKMTNLCFYLIILLIKKINTPYIANTS